MANQKPDVEIRWTLFPPIQLSQMPNERFPAEGTSLIPVQPSSGSTFYKSVGHALQDAQAQLNAHLTAWKDAVGDLERAKEDSGKVAWGMGRSARMVSDPTAGQTNDVTASSAERADDLDNVNDTEDEENDEA